MGPAFNYVFAFALSVAGAEVVNVSRDYVIVKIPYDGPLEEGAIVTGAESLGPEVAEAEHIIGKHLLTARRVIETFSLRRLGQWCDKVEGAENLCAFFDEDTGLKVQFLVYAAVYTGEGGRKYLHVEISEPRTSWIRVKRWR